ncbi:hypothetical protein [Pseudomonas atacamensis]
MFLEPGVQLLYAVIHMLSAIEPRIIFRIASLAIRTSEHQLNDVKRTLNVWLIDKKVYQEALEITLVPMLKQVGLSPPFCEGLHYPCIDLSSHETVWGLRIAEGLPNQHPHLLFQIDRQGVALQNIPAFHRAAGVDAVKTDHESRDTSFFTEGRGRELVHTLPIGAYHHSHAWGRRLIYRVEVTTEQLGF